MIFRVGIFKKIIFFIANTEEKPAIIVYYNNDKYFLLLVIYISLCFISNYDCFFKKTPENNRLKKSSWPKFCNIIFLFLLKIRSVGSADSRTYLSHLNNLEVCNPFCGNSVYIFFYIFRRDWNFLNKFSSSDPTFNRSILTLQYLKF